jgi:hypothetical protein
VAEDPTGRHGRNIALQDVQVGAADRDSIDANDGVRVVADRRLRDLLPRLVAGSVVHNSVHGSLLDMSTLSTVRTSSLSG